jgi:ABC-type multidrug transport system fused ATPase/permease subunit
MRADEYYKQVSKIVENWRIQNVIGLDNMTTVARALQSTNIGILKELERSMEGFRAIQKQICALDSKLRPVEFGLGRHICEANLHLSEALESLKPYKDFVKQIYEDQSRWSDSFKVSIGAASQMAGISAAIKRDFSLVANASLFAQQSFVRINYQAIGMVTKISDYARWALSKPLAEMANSYRSLWETISRDSEKLCSVPLVITKAPSIEIYLAAHQVEVSTTKAKVLREEEEFLIEIEPSAKHVREMITSVDEKLVPLYDGAINAIVSHNVDRNRHAITSLRELFTHMLHKLAPDEEFSIWNHDPSNIQNGRPTRKGRLLYICRKINFGEFTTFVEQDISAVLSFLDLLQKGTHAIEKLYGERQMKALLIRMECLLDFIIRISQEK